MRPLGCLHASRERDCRARAATAGPRTPQVLPAGIALDGAGALYIADAANSRVRKVSNGIITTIAGNGLSGFSGDGGPATSATLSAPVAVAVDASGNVYIADQNNSRVRKVAKGIITTVAGSGTPFLSGDNDPAINAGVSRGAWQSTPRGFCTSQRSAGEFRRRWRSGC